MRLGALTLVAAVATAQANAQEAPYAGQDRRDIATLSAAEVEGLRAGNGLGYARAAELNGWPGPLHVLELQEELGLSAEVRAEVEAIRAGMLAEARALGEELIAAEVALDALFSMEAPTAARSPPPRRRQARSTVGSASSTSRRICARRRS